ncbi:hypothetical protein [Halegenticoccus soli]|uniref:hypothetical protein n=1 Tax=Halegenticoccus soli TaxID=1985678 RepID=UPI000C6CF6CD|nr:hypothetical protein [Halegenticoccus soli]
MSRRSPPLADRLNLPTGFRDLRLVLRTTRLVLSIPAYALSALGFGVLGLSLFVLAQNAGLLFNVVLNGSVPLGARLELLVNLYPIVGTAFGPLAEALLLATAALLGVNVAMLASHLRRERVAVRDGSGSAAGVLLGTLGAGCAACGSAILSGVLSLFGAAGILTALPLEGAEFAVAALVALLLSTYWLADGMRGGEVAGCPIEFDGGSDGARGRHR